MKTQHLLFIFFITLLLTITCKKDKDDVVLKFEKIEGYAQKGPYLNGTSVTISELTSELIPTGRSFSSQIIDNKGTFEIPDVDLNSQYVELKSNGFYYNEILNENSEAQLTLYALSDLVNKTSINVNVLSSLEKNRIEYLLSTGLDFSNAKKQAQSEILSIFEINKNDIPESEILDITKAGDDNAILLAVSVILQGYLSTSDLSELIANISTDIHEDGLLDNSILGETLINNATVLNTNEIRANLENKYENLGMDITIPDFEKYVEQFIANTEFNVTNFIFYPEKYNNDLNVLTDSSFIVNPGIDYAVAVYLPKGTTIKIVSQPSQGYDWGAAGFAILNPTGYTVENNLPDNMTFTATGNDNIVNIPVKFGESSPVVQTSIDFLIYENNSSEPTRTKTVRTF